MVAEEAVPTLEEHMGQRIAARRLVQGLSLEELARLSGLTAMRLAAYEAGMRRVVPDDLFRLCNALGTGPDTFLSGIPDARNGADRIGHFEK